MAATIDADGFAVAPAAAPPVVQAVIAAGNKIARKPYIYGGGHGRWEDAGYDCSGSVSYALHGAGLLEQSMPSGGFMKWGEPGPGKWITIYANPGHIYIGRHRAALRHQRTRTRRHAMAEGPTADPELHDLLSAGAVRRVDHAHFEPGGRLALSSAAADEHERRVQQREHRAVEQNACDEPAGTVGTPGGK